MYTDNILDHITVVNGKTQYIESNTGKDSTNVKKSSKGNIRLKPEPQDAKRTSKEKTNDDKYISKEVYCIHMVDEDNCDANQDITKCGSCPYRKSGTIKIKVS